MKVVAKKKRAVCPPELVIRSRADTISFRALAEVGDVAQLFSTMGALGKELANFRGLDWASPALFRAIDSIYRFRVLVVIEKRAESLRAFTWRDPRISPTESDSLRALGLRGYADYVGSDRAATEEDETFRVDLGRDTLASEVSWRPTPILIPFRDEARRNAGALVVQGVHAPTEGQAVFLELAADLFSSAIARHRVWLDELRLREDAREELEALNHELERSNLELRQFAAVASHDLREPLRTVITYLRLLQSRHKKSLAPEALEFIQYAVEGGARMNELIVNLLEFASVGNHEEHESPTDCNEVMTEVIASLKDSIERSGAVITYTDLPTIPAIKAELIQLFQNLISNAIKFKREAVPTVSVDAKKHVEGYLFAVRDNGIGIEDSQSSRIFELFQRLHAKGEYPGTGIGLAICKKVVERRNGRIWVESKKGQGSVFFFLLPASRLQDCCFTSA